MALELRGKMGFGGARALREESERCASRAGSIPSLFSLSSAHQAPAVRKNYSAITETTEGTKTRVERHPEIESILFSLRCSSICHAEGDFCMCV